ncbi:MAG TPA: hypothetical protein EYN66_20325 [Myxococcales bacterium]|nr:hypothetical protein [Myxococcales bacterium]
MSKALSDLCYIRFQPLDVLSGDPQLAFQSRIDLVNDLGLHFDRALIVPAIHFILKADVIV